VRKHVFNPRSSDDQFTMVIELTDKTNEAAVIDFLKGVGATGIYTQQAETGWWLGRYDKDKTPFEQKGHALV
jgi:hypothetical protein